METKGALLNQKAKEIDTELAQLKKAIQDKGLAMPDSNGVLQPTMQHARAATPTPTPALTPTLAPVPAQ